MNKFTDDKVTGDLPAWKQYNALHDETGGEFPTFEQFVSSGAAALDVERLGFFDLLDVAEAIMQKYPPDTIVCSHRDEADIGARTTAAIADLIASCRAIASRRATPQPGEPRE